MNLQEIKVKLDKLNRYFEFLESSDDKISQLDKDVFLSQLRALYSDVMFSENTFKLESSKDILNTENVSEEKESIKTEIKKTPKLIFNTKETEISEKNISKTSELNNKEDIIEKEKLEPRKDDHQNIKIDPFKEEEKISVEDIIPKEADKDDFSDTEFNESYEELFFFKQATDLAEKLSESPISNLAKSLGVNEKLFYIKELFGGNAAKFNESISFFNDAGLFDKARLFMEYNLIEQFDWLNKDKKANAKEFIKTVRRRYL